MERPIPEKLRPEIDSPTPASPLEAAGIALLEAPFVFRDKIVQWKNSPNLGRSVSIGIILASLGLGLTALGPAVVSRYEKSKPVAVEATARPQEQRYVLPYTIIKAMEYEAIVLRAGAGVSFPKGMIINASNDIELTFYPKRLHDLMNNPLSGINMEPEFADILFLTSLGASDPVWPEVTSEFNNNQYKYMKDIYKHNENVEPTYWTSRIQTLGNFVYVADTETHTRVNLSNGLSIGLLHNIQNSSWFAAENQGSFKAFGAEFVKIIKAERPIEVTYVSLALLESIRNQLILKPS